MKKLFFTIAALAAFGLTHAQDTDSSKGFSKGDVFVSGNISFNDTKQGDYDTSGFTVSPTAGFFVSDNIAVGGTLSFSSYKNPNGTDTKSTGFGVGAFGRYYFMPKNPFSVFLQLNAGYSSTKNTNDNPMGEDLKYDSFNVGFGPGLNYFVSDHFALQTQLGALSYSTTKSDQEGIDARNTINVGLNLSAVTFGVLYKF